MIDRQNCKAWIDKKVFVILNNDNQYNGQIISINDTGNGLIFFELIDKFNKLVMFSIEEIKLIQEKE